MPLYAYITMAAVFITAPLIVQATPRYDELLCEEVAAAVNESVTYGTLTQQEADDISDRCYELYT
jgi:hypothetical protein